MRELIAMLATGLVPRFPRNTQLGVLFPERAIQVKESSFLNQEADSQVVQWRIKKSLSAFNSFRRASNLEF